MTRGIKTIVNSRTYAITTGLFLAIGLWFSFQPTLSLGRAGGANLEISVAQISIFIFAVLVLPYFARAWRRFRQTAIQPSYILPYALLFSLAAYSTLSLLWTPNPTRGLLITLLWWAILVSWVAVATYCKRLDKKISQKIVRASLVMAVLVSLFSWYQIFGDALGIDPIFTLLPEAYQYHLFGFARPTGFALEPQFLGSLLIAPLLYLLWQHLQARSSLLHSLILVFVSTAFFATLSRGAYAGLAAGVLLLLVIYFYRNSFTLRSVKRAFAVLLLPLVSLVLCAGFTSLAAEINQKDSINGQTAAIMSLNQLTLGVFDIPLPTSNTTEERTPAPTQPKNDLDHGYVAESTNSRLLMQNEAIALWTTNPLTMIFGIGIGGFGAALHLKDDTHSLSSIVNNQFIEILTETGIIGFGLFIAILAYLILKAYRRKLPLVIALCVAFSIQWLFFSGNVNVLHVWILFGFALALPTLTKTAANKT